MQVKYKVQAHKLNTKGRGQELASWIKGWQAISEGGKGAMFISLLQEGWKGEPNNAPFFLLYETIMYSISVQIVILHLTPKGAWPVLQLWKILCAILHVITKVPCIFYITREETPHNVLLACQHTAVTLKDLSCFTDADISKTRSTNLKIDNVVIGIYLLYFSTNIDTSKD